MEWTSHLCYTIDRTSNAFSSMFWETWPQTKYMNRPRIQCIFSAHNWGVSGPPYHFPVVPIQASFALQHHRQGHRRSIWIGLAYNVLFRSTIGGCMGSLTIFVSHPVVPIQASFAPRKLENMDSIARFISRIIHWIECGGTSTKEYNDLKQRLMKIEMKNLVYIWLLTSI